MSNSTMTKQSTMPLAAKVNAAGLVVFGAMIVFQIAIGVDDYPVVPPGLVISVVVVCLVLGLHRQRWTAIPGLLWPVFLTVGALLSDGGTADGGWVVSSRIVQFTALGVALLAGALALLQRYRR